MTSPISAAGAVIAGALLALFTVIGGVGAIAAAPNSAAKSETVVTYDAP